MSTSVVVNLVFSRPQSLHNLAKRAPSSPPAASRAPPSAQKRSNTPCRVVAEPTAVEEEGEEEGGEEVEEAVAAGVGAGEDLAADAPRAVAGERGADDVVVPRGARI